jgi:hypothetical protein
MNKVAFFHGLESTPVSDKSKAIQTMFEEAYVPAMDYRKPGLFDEVLEEVKNRKIDLLVGSSMGGWFAYCLSTLTGIPAVLFNPAVQGRSFEPGVRMGSKSANRTIVLGKKDIVIDPDKTIEWFKDNGVGSNKTYWENIGHRTPLNIFKKYIRMNENHTDKILTLEEYTFELKRSVMITEEKESRYDDETLLTYKKAYEKGEDIPFGVKTSLIAQGMIPHEGGPHKGKKVKSPEYGGPKEEGHNVEHYNGVWEKDEAEDKGEGKTAESPKGKKVKGEYLTADTKKERELMKKEIDKHAKKDPDDPSAYKDWPADYKGGDTSGERQDTKESPATIAYRKKYGDKKNESLLEDSNIETALKNKAEETGISYKILKQVHDRGMAAWRTGHKPGAPQAAWAMGRVNSFVTGEGGARKADSDLWDEHKGKK